MERADRRRGPTVLAAALYVWGGHSGIRYMRDRPALVAELRGTDEVDAAPDVAGAAR